MKEAKNVRSPEAVEQLINDPNKSAKSGGKPTVFPWLTKTHLAAHITKGVFINKSRTFVSEQSGRRGGANNKSCDI